MGEAEHDGWREEGSVAFFVGRLFKEGADVWDETAEGGACDLEFGGIGRVDFCGPSDGLGAARVAV